MYSDQLEIYQSLSILPSRRSGFSWVTVIPLEGNVSYQCKAAIPTHFNAAKIAWEATLVFERLDVIKLQHTSDREAHKKREGNLVTNPWLDKEAWEPPPHSAHSPCNKYHFPQHFSHPPGAPFLQLQLPSNANSLAQYLYHIECSCKAALSDTFRRKDLGASESRNQKFA